jgi:RNA polymerase sigma factor (sigma-70 family)
VEVRLREDADFDELYREVGPRLWRAILAYTGGRRDLTDDVVAEAFARTLESAANVRDPARYVFRVAFRLAAVELRKEPTTDRPPDRAIDDDPGLAEMFDVLARLSPGQRAAVVLRYQANLPIEEVARLMGTNSGVVRVQLLRARRRLAQLLGEDDV